MISANTQVKNTSSEELASSQGQNKGKQTDSSSAEETFLKVLQGVTGSQAQAIVNACDNLAIPEIKAVEVVEEPVVVVEAEELPQEEMPVEEETLSETEEEVSEEVKAQDNSATPEKKTETAAEQVVVNTMAQNTNVAEETALSEVLEDFTPEQATSGQSTGNSTFKLHESNKESAAQAKNLATEQQTIATETVSQQTTTTETAKVSVSDQSKVKIDALRPVEEAVALSEEVVEPTSNQFVAKAEQVVSAETKAANQAKVISSLDGLMGRNTAASTLTALSETMSATINNTSAEAVTKQSATNTASAVSSATEKSTVTKKQQTTSNSELPQKTQEKIIEKMQQMIESAAKMRNGNVMTVRLDPPELGNVTVKLTQRADQVFARIIPESSDVETTLRNSSGELINILANCGFKTDNVHISFGQEATSYASGGFGQLLSEQGFSGSSWNGSEQENTGNEGELSGTGWLAGETVTSEATTPAGWVA